MSNEKDKTEYQTAAEKRGPGYRVSAKEQSISRDVYFGVIQKDGKPLLALMPPIPRDYKAYAKMDISNASGITFIGKRAMYVAEKLANHTANMFEARKKGGYIDKKFGRINLVGRLKSTYIKSQLETLRNVVVAHNIIGNSHKAYVWANINWTHSILVQNYNDNEADIKALKNDMPKHPAVMKIVGRVQPFGNWEHFSALVEKNIEDGKFKAF